MELYNFFTNCYVGATCIRVVETVSPRLVASLTIRLQFTTVWRILESKQYSYRPVNRKT